MFNFNDNRIINVSSIFKFYKRKWRSYKDRLIVRRLVTQNICVVNAIIVVYPHTSHSMLSECRETESYFIHKNNNHRL